MFLGDITNQLLKFRRLRDWEQFHSHKNLICSISIEANELLELFQWSEECKNTSKMREEIADIFIYLLYLCHDYGIDIEQAIRSKIAINESKYPVNKTKGNSKKYDQL